MRRNIDRVYEDRLVHLIQGVTVSDHACRLEVVLLLSHICDDIVDKLIDGVGTPSPLLRCKRLSRIVNVGLPKKTCAESIFLAKGSN
jgi:hypothetical protein